MLNLLYGKRLFRTIYGLFDQQQWFGYGYGVISNDRWRSESWSDHMIYSKAYKLGADAIIINNQDTTTKTYGSVSTNRDMFFNKTIEGKTTTIAFDNMYVSYVKIKDSLKV